MAAVTQTIDSYVYGVSTAPDKEIQPGYAKNVVNGYPDTIQGMTKRPGNILAANLGTSADLDDAYFFIYRFEDKNEMYVGSIRSNSIFLRNIFTNEQATVTGATNVDYLDGGKEDFRFVQRHDDLLILNTTVNVEMSSDTISGTVSGRVNSIAELPPPESVETGDIYIIVGINGAADDYVVRWDGQTWTETIQPGMRYEFNRNTMPHRLVRTATNQFTFAPVDWDDRSSGAASQPEVPSFVGAKISNLFFYKNRLGFVSTDNVIMSQPLKFYNFWRNSALTVTDADVIDLTASSLNDVYLFAVQPTNQGLLLFSTREQFVLNAGTNGVLSPSTASIRSVSQYEMYTKIDPVLVDDKIFFTTEAGNYTRVLTMQPRGENNSPVFADIGKPVQGYIPDGINRAFYSSQNNLFGILDNTESEVFLYRFTDETDDLQMTSWFKWKYPGKILGLFIEQDNILCAVSANGQVYLLSAYLQNNTQNATVTLPGGELFINPTLDYMQTPVSVTYDSTTRLSTITVASVDPDNENWRPYVIECNASNELNGAFWELTKVTNTTYTVVGDLTGISNLQFGFVYPYEITLPQTYYRQGDRTDFTASLTISRMNFAMGRTGAVEFEVKSNGANSFSDVGEADISNWYELDTAPIDSERIFNLPIHQKSDVFTVRLSSWSPYPVSLLSMSWEGQYSPRFYQRT